MSKYQEKLAQYISDPTIIEELEMSAERNKSADTIIRELERIVGKTCYEEWRFPIVGKVIGILRFIIQNPKYQQQMLLATNLSSYHLDYYRQYGGNFPWVDKNTKEIHQGQRADINRMRKFLPLIGNILGILIEENDMINFTQQEYDEIFDRETYSINKTQEFFTSLEKEKVSDDEEEDDE